MMKERKLEAMPYDMAFEVTEGRTELCHATGVEVQFEGSEDWWNEFEDSEGNLHYGR